MQSQYLYKIRGMECNRTRNLESIFHSIMLYCLKPLRMRGSEHRALPVVYYAVCQALRFQSKNRRVGYTSVTYDDLAQRKAQHMSIIHHPSTHHRRYRLYLLFLLLSSRCRCCITYFTTTMFRFLPLLLLVSSAAAWSPQTCSSFGGMNVACTVQNGATMEMKKGKANVPPQMRGQYKRQQEMSSMQKQMMEASKPGTDGLPVFNLYVRTKRQNVSTLAGFLIYY